MFGIIFIGNFDMRRLLTDYNFKGFPLRKDFPISGFTELFFSSLKDKVVYKKVKLSKKLSMYRLMSNLNFYVDSNITNLYKI